MVQPEEATGLAPAEPVPLSAQILDLSDLLERSLRKEKAGATAPRGSADGPVKALPRDKAGRHTGKPPPHTPGKRRAI